MPQLHIASKLNRLFGFHLDSTNIATSKLAQRRTTDHSYKPIREDLFLFFCDRPGPVLARSVVIRGFCNNYVIAAGSAPQSRSSIRSLSLNPGTERRMSRVCRASAPAA